MTRPVSEASPAEQALPLLIRSEGDGWTPAQAQEWDLLYDHPRFRRAVATVRTRHRIRLSETRPAYDRATRGTGPEMRVTMPRDEAPLFREPQRSRPRSPLVSWLKLRESVHSHDIEEVRIAARLSPAWDDAIREFILLGRVVNLPFDAPRVIVSEASDATYVRLEVFRTTTFKGIADRWYWIAAVLQDHQDRIRGGSPRVDCTTPARLFIDLGSRSQRDDVKGLWPKVRRLQAKLPGRDRARHKPNLGRDRTFVLARSRGKHGKELYARMQTLFPNSPSDDHAYRVAAHRFRKRLT